MRDPSSRQLGSTVVAALRHLRERDPELDALLARLAVLGEIALVGGAPRDLALQRQPRDLDVVVDAPAQEVARALAALASRRTRFGGYGVRAGSWSLDVWPLAATWAFTPDNPRRHRLGRASFQNLPSSAFFNVDAVLVRLSDGRLFEHGFLEGLRARELTTVFTENPYPELCAARALVLAERYALAPGEGVRPFLAHRIERGLRWHHIARAQRSHYGRVLSRPEALRRLLSAGP